MTLATYQNPLLKASKPLEAPAIQSKANPLLCEASDPTADLVSFTAPSVHRRPARTDKRDLRDARRAKTAAEAIGTLDKSVEVYGYTKGQFSLIDVINHCLSFLGPASLQLSTWTAAKTEISAVLALCDTKRVTSSRWLVDTTFNRRSPALAHRIREVFGDDAIRVALNHAKFVLLDDGDWKLVIRTSMNLNYNPRFESFQIGHDPELWQFHTTILDEVWTRQKRSDQDLLRPYDLHKQFATDL